MLNAFRAAATVTAAAFVGTVALLVLAILAGYAIASIAAFAVVAELRGRTRLDDYRGLAAARPTLAAVLVVALLSLVGNPPLAGFVGKLTLSP